MLNYVFNPVVVNSNRNIFADTWLIFNMTYRFIYKFRHISNTVVELLQPLVKQQTQHKNTTAIHSFTYILLI